MGVEKEVIQLEVEIGGKKAGTTLNTLQKEYKSLNAQIRHLEPGTEKFIKKSADLRKVRDRMKVVKDEIYGVRDAQGAANAVTLEGIENTGLFSNEINTLKTGYSQLRSGIKLGVTSLKTFKGAIIATGIGALLVAIGSLVSYFTQTKRGAELLNRASAALGATWGAITDVVSALGEYIIEAFTNPREVINDFINFIKDPIQGFKDMGTAAADFAKGVAEDTKAAYSLEEAMQRVVDKERELGVERAKSRAVIKELNKIAEDVTLSEQERLAAADKAIKIEQEQMAERVRIAEERLRIISEQNNLNESSEEDLQRQADAEIALANIKEESLELQTTLNNKLNVIKQSLQRQDEAARVAEEQRIEKYLEQDRKLQEKIDEIRTQQRLSRLEDNAREIEEVKIKYSKLIEEAVGHDLKIKELEALRDAEVALKKEEQELKKQEAQIKELEDLQAFLDTVHNMKLSETDKEIAAVDAKYEKLYAAADKYYQDTAELQRMHADEITKIVAKQKEEESAIYQRETSTQKQQEASKYGAMIGFVKTYGNQRINTAISTAKEEEKIAEFEKKRALFALKINTAESISETVRDANKTGITPIEKGLIIAAGIAQIMANMRTARSYLNEEAPQYAQGGYTGFGGQKDSTGQRVAGVVHGGEWVAPSWMVNSPTFANTIGMLESARVGQYAEGGNVSTTANQDGASNQMNAVVQNLALAVEAFTQAVKKPLPVYIGEEQLESISEGLNEVQAAEFNSSNFESMSNFDNYKNA